MRNKYYTTARNSINLKLKLITSLWYWVTKTIVLIILMFVVVAPVAAQQVLPVIKASSKLVHIRDGVHFSKWYWNLLPEKKPDLYYVEIPTKKHRVSFITDVDSISFNVQYGQQYDFIILLNNKDSCYTRIVALPKKIISYKKDGGKCISCSDTIPFEVSRRNKIHIKSTINSSQPLTFQFDLGSMGMIINRSSVKKVKAKLDGFTTLTNSDGVNKVPTSSLNTFKISQLTWDSLDLTVAHNLDNGEDGIFGNSLFQNKVVEINYDHKIIIIHPALPAIPAGYVKQEVFLDNNIIPSINTELVINEQAYNGWFIFDTGHSDALVLTNNFLKANKLIDKISKGGMLGINNPIAPQVKIGDEIFSNVKTGISKSGMHSIVGNALLKRFNIILDNQQGFIYLKPNNSVTHSLNTN